MTLRLPRTVMWHYVRDADALPRIEYGGVTPAAFGDQLDAICAAYQPLGWPDVAAAIDSTRPLPPDGVLLTFDDGLIDHAESVLPALVERGLTACFFVLARRPGDGLTLGHRIHVLRGVWPAERIQDEVLDRLPPSAAASYRRAMSSLRASSPDDPDDVWKRPLQRDLADLAGPILSDLVDEEIGSEVDIAEALYLGEAHLAELVDAGMTLGGHTRTHPWLDAISATERGAEIAASAAFHARWAPGPWPFAYPYGAVPADAGALLEPAGFSAAFTTDPSERTDALHIGRVDGDDPSWAARLAGAAP